MKHAKKLASVLLALIMMLSLSVTAFAAEGTGTGTITINNATAGNTYKVYKVFDATVIGTNIVYRLMSGKTGVPVGFTVDSSSSNVTYSGKGQDDNLTEEDITAIAQYVAGDTPVTTATANGTKVEISGLSNGYYYITTTTGTAVTITSTTPNATVNDKNEAPELDKKITGVSDGSYDTDGKKALAQVGTTVEFTATITVKNGAVGYVFHDKMSNGLAYNTDSLSVKVNGTEVEEANYDKATAADDTITLAFKDAWIKNQVGKTITITYSATVTSEALSVDAAKNTARVDYGHDDHTNSTPEVKTEVYNAKFTVTKTDGSGNPVVGAGFVIKKKDAATNEAYYKIEGKDVSWVDEEHATELTTTAGANGNVLIFTGLADGEYMLIEKTVPVGYTQADNHEFTIEKGDYSKTNLEKSTTVENKRGSILPSTGGMGTTIFYAVGAFLLIGAAVLLITRKLMNDKD